jgi:putative endonuclease
MSKRKVGNFGEDIAVKFLTGKGFKIIERNYTYAHGEIDIIAEDKDTLVFVEVKYRSNLEYGYPEESISRGKIKLIRRTAEAYLYEKEILDKPIRFDVVAILEFKKGKPEITHFKNAF